MGLYTSGGDRFNVVCFVSDTRLDADGIPTCHYKDMVSNYCLRFTRFDKSDENMLSVQMSIKYYDSRGWIQYSFLLFS